MSVSAIIVNYHTSDYLPELVYDLMGMAAVEEIFIVDNSGEIELSWLQNELDQLHDAPHGGKRKPPLHSSHHLDLIQPGRNIGFGAGVNLAAKRASLEYLLVINPDVKLLPGCLDALLSGARSSGAVLTGPRFFWDDARLYRLPPSQGASAWLDFAIETAAVNRLEFEHLSFYWQARHERFWMHTTPFPEIFLSGACLLIHRPWAVENGATVFDERFFLYFEDTDISMRANMDGSPPLCIPAAEAVHHYDQSPPPRQGKESLIVQSHESFFKKYHGPLTSMIKKVDLNFQQDSEVPFQGGGLPHIKNGGSLKTDSSYHCLPEIIDLGSHTQPFVIKLEAFEPTGSLFFEIGLNPFFVPFAQTIISTGPSGENSPTSALGQQGFKIDEAVWHRMARATYYGRVRDNIKGTWKIWKWEKK